MSYDAIVVGGGISGCAAAYYLASQGHKVALIEKDTVASHASGFAFGSLHTRFQPPSGSSAIEWFRAESIDLHHELAAVLPEETGQRYHFKDKAGLVLALDEADAAMLKPSGVSAFRRNEWPSDRQDVRWLAYGELSHIEARISPDVIGGLYLGGSTEVSPGGVTAALWQAASEKYGAEMINAEVQEINVVNNAVAGVTTTQGTLSSATVLLAAGPWCGTLLERGETTSHLNLPVSPLKGEILRYDIGDEPPMPISLWWNTDYASSKPDGLLYAGTTEHRVGFDEEPSARARAEIKRSVERVLPFLAKMPVSRQTACLRPVAPDGLPVVGEISGASGLIVGTGGGRLGIELGPAIGRLAANIATGEQKGRSRYDVFSPARFA